MLWLASHPVPAQARTVPEQLIAAPEVQGHDIRDDGDPVPGRLCIVAESPIYQRELAVETQTGKVFRDCATLVALSVRPAEARHAGAMLTAFGQGPSGWCSTQPMGQTPGVVIMVTPLAASAPAGSAVATTGVVPPGGVHVDTDPALQGAPVPTDTDANPVFLSDPIALVTAVAP